MPSKTVPTVMCCFKLGPLIRAEVGDSILIVFKNKASQPYSVSAHGVEEVENEAHVTMPGKRKTTCMLSSKKRYESFQSLYLFTIFISCFFL